MNPLLIEWPERLRSERIVVRPYFPGDGPLLQEAIDSSREHLMRTMPWVREHSTVEETELRIRGFHAEWVSRGTNVNMAILNADETRILGGTGLHRINWHRRHFEIGYWIRPDTEGFGFVREAVILLCSLCFQTLDAKRVSICCGSDNVRSANVPRRLGFVEEGRLLNAHATPDGEPLDLISFAITPEIWKEKSPSWV